MSDGPCIAPQPEGFKCVRTAHNAKSPCAVVEVCKPHSSDEIYRRELAREVLKIANMIDSERNKRYGTEGWRLVIKRYLETTSPDVMSEHDEQNNKI